EIRAVLQEGAFGGDSLLVIEDSAEDEMLADVASAEAVVEPVGVLALLVKDDVGDHNIADAAVEGGGFAEDVDALDLGVILQHLAQHAVGGHAEGIVDVDDDAAALGDALDARDADARVEVLRVKLGEVEDLNVKLEAIARADVPDAALLLLDGAAAAEALTGGGAVILSGNTLERDLPIAGGADVFCGSRLHGAGGARR